VSDEFPPIPIKHEDKVVGFQLPGRSKRTGNIYTGSIYVGKEHRKKGIATQALRSFLEAHPEAISYVHNDNKISQRAHARAGWENTKKKVMGNRRATVWKKQAGISYDEILRGLSGESPQRSIPPEEVAELAKAYRDAEAKQTLMNIPVGVGVGGMLGGGLGAALGGSGNRLSGGLAGLGAGGLFGGIAGHLRRNRQLETRENLGRELGTIAQRGLPPESAYGGLNMEKKSALTSYVKHALAVTPEGHDYDARAAEIRQRAAEDLMALQEEFGARGHRDEGGGLQLGSISKALRLMLNKHPEDPRHMAYAAKKHHEGSNAWNPLGGMLTPTEREGEGGSRMFYGSMRPKQEGKPKTASRIADEVLEKAAFGSLSSLARGAGKAVQAVKGKANPQALKMLAGKTPGALASKPGMLQAKGFQGFPQNPMFKTPSMSAFSGAAPGVKM
jgi:hypothetical protein